MTRPAVHFNFQHSDPFIVKLWTQGPDAIVADLEATRQLGYGLGLWRFPDATKRGEQATYENRDDFTFGGRLQGMRISLRKWSFIHGGDFEMVAYLQPDPKPADASYILGLSEHGFTIAWDRITAQDKPSALFQRSFNFGNDLVEPWWEVESIHGAFWGKRCVVTYSEYQNRLAPGKRPDEGPMPDVYVQPDEAWAKLARDPAYDWDERESLVQFCEKLKRHDRPDARRIPMLPLDVVVRLKFDARPHMNGGGE